MTSELVSLSNGRILETHAGDFAFDFFLIASQPGHPPEAEKKLLDLLKEIHERRPLQWLFTTSDPQHVYLSAEQKELDLAPYRGFPDPQVREDVMMTMLDNGQCSAAFVFGVVSQPGVRVWPMDDWFGWALSRDSVRKLAAQSVALFVALSPASNLLDPGAAAIVERLKPLLQLQMSYSQYAELFEGGGSAPDFLRDIVRISSQPEVARFLSSALASAQDFYQGTRLRVEALVAGAIRQMQSGNDRCAAIVVDAHFADLTGSLLKERRTSFVRVMPEGVTFGPLLEVSGEFLGVTQRNNKLTRLFSAEPVRTEVEMLLERKDNAIIKERADDWSAAAQGYYVKYQLTRDAAARDRAMECLDRSLDLVPDLSNSLWLKGELYRLRNDTRRALDLFEQVIRKEPRNGHYWVSKAEALNQMGRKREAYRCYVRAIHVAPGAKESWTSLGLFLYYKGRRRAACFCFFKGKKLGCEAATDNFSMVCRGEPSRWHCPLVLQPFIIRLMQRFILPLRYGWDDVRLNMGLAGGLIVSLLTAAYGALLGFRAAGLVEGVVRFFALLLAALMAAAAVFINAAELPARGRVRAALTARVVCGLIGSIVGYNLALSLFNQRWWPLSSLTLTLAGAAVGASLWLPARLAARALIRS